MTVHATPRGPAHVFTAQDALAHAAADRIGGLLADAIAAHGRASIVLAGGSTPVPVYERLARTDAFDWRHVHVFFGDERCVPPGDAASNFRMASAALLDHVPVALANVYRMPGEVAPSEAAVFYEQTLKTYSGGGPPAFDVLLLGMGGDGHTASLFPGQPALDVTDRFVVHTTAPPDSPVPDRLTLTFPALQAARHTLFLVSGSGKHEALESALTGDTPPPAGRVGGADVQWYLDEAAWGDGV